MISIIIPCLNHWEYTEKLINSINIKTSNPYEIILINDGSNDETTDIDLDIYGIDYLVNHETNLGFPISVNKGIDLANGDYIAIFNNDMEVPEMWDSYLLDVFYKYDNIGISTGNLELNKKIYLKSKPEKPPSFTLWNKGFPFLIPRFIVEKVGYFDESFFPTWYDDIDYLVRTVIAGFRFGMANSCKLYHAHGITRKGELQNRVTFNYEQRNENLFLAKWNVENIHLGPSTQIDWEYLLEHKKVRLCTYKDLKEMVRVI